MISFYEGSDPHCPTHIARLIVYRRVIDEQIPYLPFDVQRFGFKGIDPALQQRLGLAQIADAERGERIFRAPPGYDLHGSDHPSQSKRLPLGFVDRLLDVFLNREEIFCFVKPQRTGLDTGPDLEHLLFSLVEVLVGVRKVKGEHLV